MKHSKFIQEIKKLNIGPDDLILLSVDDNKFKNEAVSISEFAHETFKHIPNLGIVILPSSVSINTLSKTHLKFLGLQKLERQK